MADTPEVPTTEKKTKGVVTNRPDGQRGIVVRRDGKEIQLKWKKPSERVNASDLPQWVKLALADCVMYDLTFAQAAKRYKRKPGTLYAFTKTPAAKSWLTEIRKHVNDPEAMAQAILRGAIVGVTKGYLWAYDAAKAAEDYQQVAAMSKDMFDRFGVRKGGATPSKDGTKVVINLGSITLTPPMVETTFRENLPAEIVDDVDDY